MLIIYSSFTNVRATHTMLFLCGPSRCGSPFCSVSTTCSSCPSVISYLLLNCFIALFTIWFLSFSTCSMAERGHAYITSWASVEASGILHTFSSTLSSPGIFFFYSNSCTFSSRNSSCNVYLVQPNELPDKPFLFLNLTLEYPLLFHKFPMSLQLWKYRFNWFHSYGNHQPTPFLIMTFN